MRTTSYRTTIKRIFALGLGLFSLFFTNDITWMIFGGILLIWAVVNMLGDKYYTFEVIGNILDMIAGLSAIVLGVVIAISEFDWVVLFFSVFGLIIFLQGLLPIIAKMQSKHTVETIKKAAIQAKEKELL